MELESLAHKLITIASNRKVQIAAFSILILVLLFSIPNRAIQSDENWLGEQAYWFATEGVVKLESIPGIFKWDTEMPVHHKLLTWTGAVIIEFFGWGLLPLRIYMITLTGCTILAMFQLPKSTNNLINKDQVILAIVLLLITPEFIERVLLFRPELPVMAFGMMAFIFLNKTRTYKPWKFPILAGIFSGIAFLGHLNGVIFPMAGFLLLLMHRKWRSLLLFSIPCFLTCLIYTEGLWLEANFTEYVYELKNWPSHNFKEKVDGGIISSIFNNLLGLLKEHKRYFWDQNVWVISGAFFISLMLYFKTIRNEMPFLIDYVLLLMVLLGLLGGGQAPRYLMFIFPYMALICAKAIQIAFQRGRKFSIVFYLVVIVAQLVFIGSKYVSIFQNKFDFQKWNNEVLTNIEPNSSLIGPWHLIYNNIDQYQIINYKTFEYREEKRPVKFSQLEVLEDVYNREVEFIVLDEQMKNDKVMHWFHNWMVQENPYYQEFKRGDDYLILKRI